MLEDLLAEEAHCLFTIKQDLLNRGWTAYCPFNIPERYEASFDVCADTCFIMFPRLEHDACPCGSFTNEYKIRVINKTLKHNGYDIKTGKKVKKDAKETKSK